MYKQKSIKMKTTRYFIIVTILLSVLSCSVQNKLNHQFIGQDKKALDEYFEQTGIVVPISAERQMVVYTYSKALPSITINKGVTTLDPMVSPSVQKTQKFTFYLDKNGKVTECKYDLSYQQ